MYGRSERNSWPGDEDDGFLLRSSRANQHGKKRSSGSLSMNYSHTLRLSIVMRAVEDAVIEIERGSNPDPESSPA